jgi:hypothetical protein
LNCVTYLDSEEEEEEEEEVKPKPKPKQQPSSASRKGAVKANPFKSKIAAKGRHK